MWQPIETAPKDGSPILLGWVGSGVSEGLWRDGMANYWNLSGFYFTDDDPLTAKPCTPTHWMPLPPPPQVQLPSMRDKVREK